MKAVKVTLDLNGILSPGMVLPEVLPSTLFSK
jgi:hypothetical protein